jgi:hypothetical protein
MNKNINCFRTTPVKQEPSLSPPPPKYSGQSGKDVLLDGVDPAHRKRNSRKSSNEMSESEPEKRSKKKCTKAKNAAKEAAATNPDGSKRVYVCPHCQRSYDWNYNLNRHLVNILSCVGFQKDWFL